MATDATIETAIFERLVLAGARDPGDQIAKSVLALDFSPEDRARMQLLADRAKQGTLTANESEEIESYERVGHYLAILQSKARLTIRNQPSAG